ncbi:MAG: lamin tail domain-containing protein [Parcubacteria group bacterium]|nr:lamin tail domain-containing protein [Parcubacteria group bacterium]
MKRKSLKIILSGAGLFFISFYFIFFPKISYGTATGDVIINEVAWMGTKASFSDEWIELFNKTSETINLEGWVLYEAGGDTKIISLVGNISPNNYYLIERTDDSTISDIKADVSGSFGDGNGLANAGERLVLKDAAGNIIDEIDALSVWPAGKNDLKASMEKATDGSWQTNNQITINGKDALGNPIIGTPRSQNSILTIQTIQTDNSINATTTQTSSSNQTSLPTPETQSINSPESFTADAGKDVQAKAGQTVIFDGSNSSNPNNSQLTYKWNFGDGQTGEGIKIEHNYKYEGDYIAALIISDGVAAKTDQLNVQILPTGIFINEFMPSPIGKDIEAEWIEIFNDNNRLINLSQWKLDDGPDGSKAFIFHEETFISGKGYLILSRPTTKLALNNKGGEIDLIYPNGEIADKIAYDKALEGFSAGRKTDGTFSWTENSTPGGKNIFNSAEEPENKNSVKMPVNKVILEKQIQKSSPAPINLADLKSEINSPIQSQIAASISGIIQKENLKTLLGAGAVIIASLILFAVYKIMKKSESN